MYTADSLPLECLVVAGNPFITWRTPNLVFAAENGYLLGSHNCYEDSHCFVNCKCQLSTIVTRLLHYLSKGVLLWREREHLNRTKSCGSREKQQRNIMSSDINRSHQSLAILPFWIKVVYHEVTGSWLMRHHSSKCYGMYEYWKTWAEEIVALRQWCFHDSALTMVATEQ